MLLSPQNKMDAAPTGARAKWLVACGALILSAVSASWMLSARTLDSHECFVSVTAREMLQSGDWMFPTMNGQPRLNKTPLPYWLVAALAEISGRVNEFTARLPSAVFAFLSATAILYFVNRWLSFRTAALCTAVWATSLSYVRCSHSAKPDMALTFFVMLSLLSFYSAVTTTSPRERVVCMLIFWTSFGLANLVKGPAPVPYVCIPTFLYIAIDRKWRLLPRLLPLIGSIIVLTIVMPWPLFVANKLNWDLSLWKNEFIDRFFGDYAPGSYPIYYYFLIMFKYVTPWVAFLPMALVAPFYRVWAEKRPLMRYLWLWFVADFAFLTIDAGKRQHYILPLMPAMAILIGILLEDMVFLRNVCKQKLAKNILIAHARVILVGAIGGLIFIALAMPQLLGRSLVLGMLAIAATVIVLILFARARPAAASGALFTGIVVWIMVCFAGFSTVLDDDRYARDFARSVVRIVPPSDRLVAYGQISGRFVQYFGKVVPGIRDESILHDRYEQGDWVVCTYDYLKELTSNDRLRQVYHQEQHGKEDTGGALFHKSAPLVTNEDNSSLKGEPLLPSRR
jgi:4-amino-4-deoxy-L-arabinose transferase-like glycosyltransferase